MIDIETHLDEIYDAIIDGKKEIVVDIVQTLINEKVAPKIILDDAMIPAMDVVGQRFEEGSYFVPEMLVSAKAMQAGMDLLKPLLVQAGIEPIAKVAIGTIKSDIHDIGKNLVAMMLEGAGFEVVDLGVNVAPAKFVEEVKKGAQLIGISALLTTTMVNMPLVIKALIEADLRDKVKVIIGGAPITEDTARQFGADGYAPDANQAVVVSKSLLGIT